MDANRLKSVPVFADVSDEELQGIATFANEVSVSEGKVLVSEGDYSYQFITILEGEAEVTRDDEKLAELGPGDFFGEMGMITQDRRNATVTAKTAMQLVTLDSWDWKRMEKSMPDAVEKIYAKARERHHQA